MKDGSSLSVQLGWKIVADAGDPAEVVKDDAGCKTRRLFAGDGDLLVEDFGAQQGGPQTSQDRRSKNRGHQRHKRAMAGLERHGQPPHEGSDQKPRPNARQL